MLRLGAIGFGAVLFLCAAAPMPAAAQIAPAHIELTVTGDPATPAFLTQAIPAAVISALSTRLGVPAAALRAPAILPAPQVLGRGFLTSFSVPVRIDFGGGAPAAEVPSIIDVTNADVPGFRPVRLAFEDDPERIDADGVLSRTTVDARQPTRLYYYHENRRRRRRFCIVLSANDSVLTRVAVVAASGGPNIDVMGVGHAVTKDFLTVQPHNEGVVLDIAGGKPFVAQDLGVGPGDGVAGAIDFRVLVGGPLTATVMAIPPGAQPATYLYAAKLGDDGHLRHGTFDLRDFGQRIIAYTPGGRDATYRYGNRQQTPQSVPPGQTGHDFGDYGVLQRVTFDIDNPSTAATTLYLYERPLGGVVRSSFIVDGTLIDVGCVRVPNPYLIAPYALGPRATGRLEVETMTDGGSNYPLEIGLTTLPPLRTTPAIRAADGCFPKPAAAGAAQPAGGSKGH